MGKSSRVLFLANLNRLMDQKKIQNKDMADGIGVSGTTVGRWRAGEAQPRFADMDAMAKYLGVQVSDFFDDPEALESKEPYERAFAVIKKAISDLDLPMPEPASPSPSGNSTKAAKKPRR